MATSDNNNWIQQSCEFVIKTWKRSKLKEIRGLLLFETRLLEPPLTFIQKECKKITFGAVSKTDRDIFKYVCPINVIA